jgi:hypothetical protein
MRNIKRDIILTGLFAMLVFFPVRYTDCGSTATGSQPSEENCDWYCKNLKQDWNYIFHPDRINQCKPREIKNPGNGGAPGSAA